VSQSPSATAKFLEIIFIRALPPNVFEPALYKTSNTTILARKTRYLRSGALEEMVSLDLGENPCFVLVIVSAVFSSVVTEK
jgi:hypothetical protein